MKKINFSRGLCRVLRCLKSLIQDWDFQREIHEAKVLVVIWQDNWQKVPLRKSKYMLNFL